MEPRYSLEPVRYENRSGDMERWKLALALTLMGIAFALGFLFSA